MSAEGSLVTSSIMLGPALSGSLSQPAAADAENSGPEQASLAICLVASCHSGCMDVTCAAHALALPLPNNLRSERA